MSPRVDALKKRVDALKKRVDALKNAGVVKKKIQKYTSVKKTMFVNCLDGITKKRFHSKAVKLWLNITAHTVVHNANIKNNLAHAIVIRRVVVFVLVCVSFATKSDLYNFYQI